MKNSITLLLSFISYGFLLSQTSINFAASEGFTNNIPMYNQTGWSSSFSGSTWFADTTNENIYSDHEYARVAWGQEFYHGTTGDEITFRVELNFAGSYISNFSNVGLLQIGFSTTNNVENANPTVEGLYLRASGWDEKIQLSTTTGGNGLSTAVKVSHPNNNDEFAVELTLTLGADAASSTLSAKLINLTTSEVSNVGSYTAIDANVFSAATTGLYGYIKSDNFKNANVGSLTKLRVTKVQMTGGTHNFTNGSGDGEWSTATNWTKSSVPTSSTLVTIKNGQSTTINSVDSAVKDLQIDNGGTMTVANDASLTVSGDIRNSGGTVTLNSDSNEFSSIIVQGSSSGDITYNRYVNAVGTDEWDLIGSPVTGQDINTFASTNSTPLATAGGAGSDQYAIGLYDNSNDSWVNYNTSSLANAGDFDLGKGYQIGTDSGATLAFTGTIATTDQTVAIIDNDAANSGSGRIWNLIANPFPSYLNANSATSGTNFITVNESNLHSSYAAIYGYDADGSGYTIYNNSSSATYIAPGQAFFVASDDSGGNTVTFSEAMQTVTGTDDFIAGRLANTSSELYLKLYEGENLVGDTKFYFDNNLSLGLDPGYDAGAYNQSSALSSRLSEDDQGVNMGINAMGIDSFEQTTIPIVVNRQAGTSFRISLEDLTIPESVEVFLEDTETQNFTNLRTEDFTLNPQSELSGMGRFYLRLGNTSLGGSDIEESYISIYNPMDKDYITIEGLASIQKANVRLYNIIGQEILSKTLQTGLSTQNISTAGLTTGIYVIKLQVDSTLISKKIVIN